jgi:hypothetical protein
MSIERVRIEILLVALNAMQCEAVEALDDMRATLGPSALRDQRRHIALHGRAMHLLSALLHDGVTEIMRISGRCVVPSSNRATGTMYTATSSDCTCVSVQLCKHSLIADAFEQCIAAYANQYRDSVNNHDKEIDRETNGR